MRKLFFRPALRSLHNLLPSWFSYALDRRLPVQEGVLSRVMINPVISLVCFFPLWFRVLVSFDL